MHRVLHRMPRPSARAARLGRPGPRRVPFMSWERCASHGSAADAIPQHPAPNQPQGSSATPRQQQAQKPLGQQQHHYHQAQPAEAAAPNPHDAAVPAVPAAAASADLPFYGQFPLDRHAEWRRDDQQLQALFSQSDAKLVPLLRDLVLVRPAIAPSASYSTPATTPSSPSPAAPLLHPVLLSPAAAHVDLIADSPARIFLGTDATGAPYFAAAVASPAAAKQVAAAHPGSQWRAARNAGPDMAPGDASLLAVASGLMLWHGSNGFCAATGAPSVASPGGHSRKCDGGPRGGGGSVYPRIDPAVIMLVAHREFALLGRKGEWPQDRYSTLAGFLELGEPLEAAVAREVEEEAGVLVDPASITYQSSQPWPFPRSLMVGFNARAAPATSTLASACTAAARTRAAAAAAAASAAAADAHRDGTNNGTSTSGGAGDTAPTASGGGSSSSSHASWWRPAAAGPGAGGFELLPAQGRRAALDCGIFAEEVWEVLGPLQDLQWPVPDLDELQDVRWFHRDWIQAVFRTPGGAAVVPGAGQFSVPGPYSLAHRLITSWAGCSPCGAAGVVGPAGTGAAAPPSSAAAPDTWPGDSVPQVLISGSGTFKYVLMRLWDPSPEGTRSKLLVWGDTRAPYHNDVLQKAKAMVRPLGLTVSPLGGGRMDHDPVARRIQVYGYSSAFGPAPHEVTAALLHRWYPLYDKEAITVSYEGY